MNDRTSEIKDPEGYDPPTGKEFKKLLRRWGLTKDDTAVMVDLDASQIQRFIRGKEPVPFKVLSTLADKQEGWTDIPLQYWRNWRTWFGVKDRDSKWKEPEGFVPPVTCDEIRAERTVGEFLGFCREIAAKDWDENGENRGWFLYSNAAAAKRYYEELTPLGTFLEAEQVSSSTEIPIPCDDGPDPPPWNWSILGLWNEEDRRWQGSGTSRRRS